MTDLDRSIENLADKIDALAVLVVSLDQTITHISQQLERHTEVTRDFQTVFRSQAENFDKLLALAQQKQTTIDRLLSKLEGTP